MLARPTITSLSPRDSLAMRRHGLAAHCSVFAVNLLAVCFLMLLWPLLLAAFFGTAALLLIHDAVCGAHAGLRRCARRLLPMRFGGGGCATASVATLAAPVGDAANGPCRPMAFVLSQAALFEPGSVRLTPSGRTTLVEMAHNVVVPLRRVDVIARAFPRDGIEEDRAAAAMLAAARATAIAALMREERLAKTVGIFGSHTRPPPGEAMHEGTIELVLRQVESSLRDVA